MSCLRTAAWCRSSRRTSPRRLVFAQALESGLADEVVGGPGGEVDLGDELGFDPDSAAAGFWRDGFEGRGLGAQFVERVAQAGVDLLGEAGAGASGIDELAVVVVAEEQRADAVDAHSRAG